MESKRLGLHFRRFDVLRSMGFKVCSSGMGKVKIKGKAVVDGLGDGGEDYLFFQVMV